MNKEKKIAEFQNATVATIKAIAANKLKNREIQFFGNTTRFNSKQITIAKNYNDFDETLDNFKCAIANVRGKKRNPLSMEIVADPEVQKFNAESFDF